MDKDTATNILYRLVAAIGTLEQKMAMDVVIKELGYDQVDNHGIPVIIYEKPDISVRPTFEDDDYSDDRDYDQPSHGYWEAGDY